MDELKGKTYDEERVTSWAVAIAEAVKQGTKGMCGCDSYRKRIDGLILIVSLFPPSSLSIKAQNIPRYKIVVQVALGEMREQGVRVASRCLWDPVTDNHASAAFTNVRSKSKMLQFFFLS